jgi:hypothetical protein
LPEWEATIQFSPPPSTAGKLCELSVNVAACLFDSHDPATATMTDLATYAVQLSLPQPNSYSSINTVNTDWYGKTVVQPNPPNWSINSTITMVGDVNDRTQNGSPVLVRIPQGPTPLRLSLLQNNLNFYEYFSTPNYYLDTTTALPTASPTLHLLISLEPIE